MDGLTIYIPRDVSQRLRDIAAEIGRDPDDLALAAIENAICDYDRSRPTPPKEP